jgi:hypothetical protein
VKEGKHEPFERAGTDDIFFFATEMRFFASQFSTRFFSMKEVE